MRVERRVIITTIGNKRQRGQSLLTSIVQKQPEQTTQIKAQSLMLAMTCQYIITTHM